ncbi:ribonuclease Z [archaeon SCG-AAA382B04]|nr:ribonuclease Z [archaeon SCG-AAA382B04]
MSFEVTFLGTAGATPTVERNPPSILVKREGELLLFDCGEGTQRQMMKAGTGMAVDKILISHFHGDHFLGIPGLIQTMAFQDREKPLTIIGPPGIKRLSRQMAALGATSPKFDLKIKEVSDGDCLKEEGYSIDVLEADHGKSIQALSYVLEEDERPGKFDREKAIELGIQPGPKFSRLQHGDSVKNSEGEEIKPSQVLGSPRRGRKFVYSGDTRPLERIKQRARKADLLIHDATLSEEEKERAKKTKHSTAKEAAELAKDAEVRLLSLFHLSSRYSKNFYPLLNEAQEVFEDTVVPRDFTNLRIPYPEKGREIEVNI